MQLVLAVVRVNDIHEDYHWPINAWVELYTVTLTISEVLPGISLREVSGKHIQNDSIYSLLVA